MPGLYALPGCRTGQITTNMWAAADAGQARLHTIFPCLCLRSLTKEGYEITTGLTDYAIILKLWKFARDEEDMMRTTVVHTITEPAEVFPSENCIAQLALFIG